MTELVRFICKWCGCRTTLHGVENVPLDELCPPCHFFGPDWEKDPVLVKMTDDMQNRNCQ